MLLEMQSCFALSVFWRNLIFYSFNSHMYMHWYLSRSINRIQTSCVWINQLLFIWWMYRATYARHVILHIRCIYWKANKQTYLIVGFLFDSPLVNHRIVLRHNLQHNLPNNHLVDQPRIRHHSLLCNHRANQVVNRLCRYINVHANPTMAIMRVYFTLIQWNLKEFFKNIYKCIYIHCLLYW